MSETRRIISSSHPASRLKFNIRLFCSQLKARIRARQMGGGGSAGAGTKRDKVQQEAEEILGAMERDKTQLQFVVSQVCCSLSFSLFLSLIRQITNPLSPLQESERQKTIIRGCDFICPHNRTYTFGLLRRLYVT